MAHVVSVNVGLPREIVWRGKTVRSAIWKSPVAGRARVTRLNIEGDGQADLNGHGGEQRAVFVYQMDSYRHWSDFLARTDLVPGTFGENLTIEGLADADVYIGDRYRIGSALFEVSQPRVTCYKVGIRLDHPPMPALLVAHKRTGFYFRVVEEGEIGAGDVIERVAEGPERMSVTEVDALLYTSEHPVEALQRALKIPALSPGWQGSMKSLLDAAKSGASGGNAGLSKPRAPLAWDGYRALRVRASDIESKDVRSFEIGDPAGEALPPWLPGQHIILRLRPVPDGAPVLRNYSLCGVPGDPTYRIAVKNEGGPGSGFLHNNIRSGSMLDVSAPRGSFVMASGDRPVVLLSAGIGITPVLAMLLAAAAEDGQSPREVWWVHGARNGAAHSFASLTRSTVARLAHGHHHVVYSRPAPTDVMGRDYDEIGHVDAGVLQRLGVPLDADFYICGPLSFAGQLKGSLGELGVDAHNIHDEAFGGPPTSIAQNARPPHQPEGPEGRGPLVTFAKSGLSVRWDQRFTSLLDLAEACDVPVRWSCRSGVCHLCETGVVDGSVDYDPAPLDPPADGNCLLCCGRPSAEIALDI